MALARLSVEASYQQQATSQSPQPCHIPKERSRSWLTSPPPGQSGVTLLASALMAGAPGHGLPTELQPTRSAEL